MEDAFVVIVTPFVYAYSALMWVVCQFAGHSWKRRPTMWVLGQYWGGHLTYDCKRCFASREHTQTPDM